MRSEAEIRQYRDALKVLFEGACTCGGGDCKLGRLLMSDAVNTLTWALGESDELSRRVETCVKGAAEVRAKGG